MRTIIVALTSALLLAAIIVELGPRFWPDSTIALFLLCAFALFISGLFNARLATRQPAGANA